MPMKGITPGSDNEAQLKADGLYIPDILNTAIQSKLGVITTLVRRHAVGQGELKGSVDVIYIPSKKKNVYLASLTLPYDKNVTTEEATYRKYEERFEKAEAALNAQGKSLNITWRRETDAVASLKADSFDDLMAAVFDVQLNPMIEEANQLRTPPAQHKPVPWRQLVEDDAKGLYDPPPAYGPFTAALQRREDEHSKSEGRN